MSHHESHELDSDYTQMDERKDAQAVAAEHKTASPHLTATPIEPNAISIGTQGSPMQSTMKIANDRRAKLPGASPESIRSSSAHHQKRVIAFSAGEFAADDTVVNDFLKTRTIGDKLHSRIETITAGSDVAETDDPFTASPHQVRLETYQKSKFGSNRIQSARYTLFTFLPLNLWSQLSPFIKPANFYFLIIAILQAIPSISTTNGRPSILVPLIFVLTVTAIKDAIEDYHRAKSDRIKNDAVYLVFRREEHPPAAGSGAASPAKQHKLHGRWIHEFSRNLLVGDFIFIENNQRIPADILLAASGIERGTHAFIDTKDLDGETNLKPKFVPQNLLAQRTQQQMQPQQSQSHQQVSRKPSVSEKKVQPGVIEVSEQKKEESIEQSQAHMVGYLTHLNGELEYDLPNGDMSEWHASLQVRSLNAPTGNFAMASSSSSSDQKSYVRQNMGLDALILADCLLRNTPWMIGLCVYTGDETKLRRNMTKQLRSSRIKETGVFRLTKKLFVFMASAQFLLCLTAGIACGILQSSVQQSAFYLQFTTNANLSGFLQVFTWFILAKDFVPISLYVSMELVQFWQALFIGLDKKMSVQVANPNKVAESSGDGDSGKESKKKKKSKWHRGKKGDRSGDLTSDELETIYAKAQTSRLNEELSQVSYIFSDKTGTLTQNSMNFKKCVIGAVTYGQQTTEAGAIRHAKLDGQDVTKALAKFEKQKEQLAAKRRELNVAPSPHVEFDEKEKLMKALWENGSGSSSPSNNEKHSAEIREYLLALALNNAVFPKVDVARSGAISNHKPDLTHPDSTVVMSLDSSSPDERALAYFAQYAGFELFSRAGGLARVRVTDGAGKRSFLDFNDVALLDFSAKRKRMTVLVEALDEHGVANGKLKVYMKGADSFVYPLLVGASNTAPAASDDNETAQSNSGNNGPKNWTSTYANLVEFGGESLRTLVIAAGEQSREWWFGADGVGGMKETYEKAQRSQGDKEKGHTDGSCSNSCSMCAIEERIEREANLHLIGATAIEDLLQDGVGGALKGLLEANIKVWMLTGDNVSTAINIAISCNLLEADYEEQGRLFKLDREEAESLDTLHKVLQKALDKIRYIRSDAPEANFGLAMHSDTWKLLFHDEEEEAQTAAAEKLSQKKQQRNKELQQQTLDMFFEVAANCRSVIACRLEPKEKAQIVEEMRRRTKKVCLAIGDGNNDIPMIKSGDIGVGIRGVEGTGAVASADYSISQFRFICRLLFAYGHLNYRRMSLLISYIFYKSSILVWCAYCLGAYSMYSGQSVFMDWSFQLYNIAYTALPILIVAVLDRDFDMDTLEKHPLIYDATRGMTYFNKPVLVRWLLWGLIDSLVCFFVPYYTFGETATQKNGLNAGFAAQGLVVYTCVCMVVNLKLLFFVRSFTWLHVASFLLSFGVYWAATFIFNASSFFSIGGLDYYRVFSFLISEPRFWLTLLFCLGVSALINLLYITLWETMFPRSRVQIYYEAYILGKNLDDVDAAYRENDKLNPSRNSALLISNGISIRGSAQHTPPPAAPLLRSHASQSKGNQVSDVEQDQILTSVVAPLDSHSRNGTGASNRATFRSPVPIRKPFGGVETKEVPSPAAGTHFRIRASSDVDEQHRGVNIGSYLPSPVLGPASGPPLPIQELDRNKKILASRLPRSEISDAGTNTVSSANFASMSATHLIKQPSLPVDTSRVVSTTSFIEFHTEIEDKESPYTGFAFNHTPIGRLRSINTFVPVHEAHSIPK